MLIICEQSNLDSKQILNKSMKKLEELDCHDKVKIEILKSEHGRQTCDIIRYSLMAWTDKSYIDFIYVGNKGADFASRSSKSYLGSVTNEIIKHTKLNVFFIP